MIIPGFFFQVFHICDTSRKISFLCPNGTIFSQSHLICDWWFKVDCASAPALYESSAEYYSNEQKKTQKITHSLSKNQDLSLQQIGDSSNRAESRRSSVNVPSTTERLLRHRQRLQTELPYNGQATARSYQALFPDNFNQAATQKSLTTAFEKRRKNLVQLISNNFSTPAKSTQATFYETSSRRTTPTDNFKEMQVAAESASFANNNNRQFLQDYHNKNYRPYPVYTPNTPKPRTKSNPNLTTLYDIRDKDPHASYIHESTKRPTLLPYTRSYTTASDPYTRPGVSLLKNFLVREKNRTIATTTERNIRLTTPNENRLRNNRLIIESKSTFESATKIPTTKPDIQATQTASSDRYDVYSTAKPVTETTTETNYKERRERLMRKLNFDKVTTTPEPTEATTTEKFYGDKPNRPGLIVPPSLTPKTLHSLAIYYATALDNLSTPTPDEEGETTTPAFDEYAAMEEALPALFSQQTITKYSNLFSPDNADFLEDVRDDPNGTYNELMEDLAVQQSQNPLATSPQIRELAQVFTHALSAYLQDPVQFRKVLSDIRPTHPSFGELLSTTEDTQSTEPTTTIDEEDQEILGFSEDNKARPLPSLRDSNSLREGKALNLGTKLQNIPNEEKQTTPRPVISSSIASVSPEYVSPTYYASTTPRNPFRCCGRISASYTTASTPFAYSTTPLPRTNAAAYNINTLANTYEGSTTDTYSVTRFGGFQNNALTSNDSPYGSGLGSTQSRPLSEYVEATNLPTAWGIDSTGATSIPVSTQDFESKRIRTTTVVPTTTTVYFTETDSVELENDEELQRAHSQSFIPPQSNSLRQGKQLNLDEKKVKKPSEDLEAPILSEVNTAAPSTEHTSTLTTTFKPQEETASTPIPSSIFTSPDVDKSTNYQWTNSFDNWQSTVIDPITLNDGLSHTATDDLYVKDSAYTATTPTIDYSTTEQGVSTTSRYEPTTFTSKNDNRVGRLLNDVSTEPAQDLSAITDTVVEKAKEIMGGMNATTTEKLMNVMKKTKSKTVKRLILLLVQTCDDDHNTTAEASKKALLEALMAVSQQDMDEIAKEEGLTPEPLPENEGFRRTDRFLEQQEVRPRQDRRGKSLNFDPSAINSLSNPTTEKPKENQPLEDLLSVSSTVSPTRATATSRRGIRKFGQRTTPIEARSTKPTPVDTPKAEALVAPKELSDLKTPSDTRALELLRSLYTIAARWG